MNIQLIVQRLRGKATCVADATAKIGSKARIFNIGDDSSLIRIGASTIINGELLVFPHGGNIQIGERCYVGEGTRIWSDTSINIGHRVMIAHNVNIFDNLTHPIDATARHAHFRQIATRGHPKLIDLGGLPIQIADDAWIAAGAFVLRGVSIGKGAIVGAGAVVADDVPAGAIVAGNPARLVRSLGSSEPTCSTKR